MTTYKVRLNLVQQVIQTYTDEFDVTDQAKWEKLRSASQNYIEAPSLKKIPEKAPSDPIAWLELYQLLDRSEYEQQENDWWCSEENGSTESLWILEDDDGVEIERIE